jgi:hypothetical protein
MIYIFFNHPGPSFPGSIRHQRGEILTFFERKSIYGSPPLPGIIFHTFPPSILQSFSPSILEPCLLLTPYPGIEVELIDDIQTEK